MATNQTAPRIAAAYVRVSTDEQAEQSPESQLIEIRKYADRQGYIIPDEFVFMDEGISGKRSVNRPAFQQMIGTAKEKPAPFETILLWKFSRFARNQEESIVYKALLRKQCGVDVVSVSEPLPGGMFSSLIERIIEWFDEFYSIRLSQEVKRTMTVKATRGEFQASPSFGYRVRMESGEKSVLEPIPEEAALVQEMFCRFVAGEGCYSIARWLNAQGITTHRGNKFENRTVEYILRNPVYIGKLRWTPTGHTRRNFNNPDTIVADAGHEAIVDTETWEAAQERMAQIKLAWGYKARPTYELKDWLSGVVRCSDCGTTLVFTKPHYFKCNNYAKGRCTSSQHVHVDALHEAVLERLRQDMDSALPLAFTVCYSSPLDSGEMNRLELSLADLQRRNTRLLDAYLGGAMELDTYKGMKESLDSAIQQTRNRLEELQNQHAQENSAAMLQSGIRQALNTLTDPTATLVDKNNAIRSVTDKIVWNKAEKTLDITYRIIF
jgi:DNA invertase Pin-like site-specific DNA recombinase